MRVYRTTPITVAGANPPMTLDFTNERFNSVPPMWTLAQPSRITAPVAGRYQISAQVEVGSIEGAVTRPLLLVTAFNADGTPIGIIANDVAINPVTTTAVLQVSTLWELAAGQFVTLSVASQAGLFTVNVNNLASPEFMAARVG